MADKKKVWRPGGAYFYISAVLVFLLGVGGVFLLSVEADLAMAEQHLSSVVEYVSEQCTTYTMTSTASETKSLMRVMEAAQQTARDIQYLHAEPSEELLRSLAEDHALSGILLLNADGQITASYITGSDSLELLSDELEKSTLLDTAANPIKLYTGRVYTGSGDYLDLAAFGRLDADGLVVVYYRTPVAYINAYGLAFPSLLEGYQIDRDGTLVVTDGTEIVSSNDDTIVGLDVSDIPVLQHISQRGQNGKLLTVRSDNNVTHHRSFGMIRRGRTYYVYAFMPERSIFSATMRNTMIALFFYALVLLLVQMLRSKTTQHYHELQLRQEREYQGKLVDAARRAESANRAKTEFLQRMSHDIRTPINGILGMVEIGDYYSGDLDRQSECRRKIRDASQLLLELVNEVLDMGKLESGEVVLEERPFDLVVLLDSIGTTLEQTAKERGIRTEHRPRQLTHTALVGSPLHLKRLLMNIYSNAVKYNKDNGSITLTARELRSDGKTAWIEFTCADTGIGMSEEYQKHLFEPFTQENSSARSSYNGTGLGMSITKALVDKMGGTIEFESHLNVGTTFRITLPFRICSESELPHPEAAPVTEESLKGMRILVAEDNALNMEIVEFLLRNAGVEMIEAFNGQEAVNLFRASAEGSIDVILMDVMMPVMDGYRATRIIREMDRPDAATVPIFAMTAHAFTEDRRQSSEAGMNEHLTKPLDPSALIQALAKYRKG